MKDIHCYYCKNIIKSNEVINYDEEKNPVHQRCISLYKTEIQIPQLYPFCKLCKQTITRGELCIDGTKIHESCVSLTKSECDEYSIKNKVTITLSIPSRK